MVPTREECLACRCAQRRRMEAIELEPVLRQTFGGWSRDRTSECRRCRETDVVQQDDEHVRRTRGRTQRLDRWKRRRRIFRIEDGRRLGGRIGNRKDRTVDVAHRAGSPDGWKDPDAVTATSPVSCAWYEASRRSSSSCFGNIKKTSAAPRRIDTTPAVYAQSSPWRNACCAPATIASAYCGVRVPGSW